MFLSGNQILAPDFLFKFGRQLFQFLLHNWHFTSVFKLQLEQIILYLFEIRFVLLTITVAPIAVDLPNLVLDCLDPLEITLVQTSELLIIFSANTAFFNDLNGLLRILLLKFFLVIGHELVLQIATLVLSLHCDEGVLHLVELLFHFIYFITFFDIRF